MRRKRDTPELALHRVITALEASDELNHPSHHQAIRELVLGGPFQVNETYRAALRKPHPLVSGWRAEFVQYLRTLVRLEGRTSWITLQTDGPFQFSGALIDGHVYPTVDSQSIRDLALLHLQFRLQEVGLRNVRACPACQHLFVKHYRQEYCSVTCQQRVNKRRLRAREREETERRTRRRIRKGRG